jgi:cytochrome c
MNAMFAKLSSLLGLLVVLVACAEEEEAPLPTDEERLAAMPDPAYGQRLFRQCAVCHNAAPDAGHRVGPNLWGVMSAEAGRHPDFSYSRALERANLVWDEETLGAYIADPQAVIPGGRMAYAGMESPADRRDLIAFLKTRQNRAAKE